MSEEFDFIYYTGRYDLPLDEEGAKKHYLEHGQKEGKICKPPYFLSVGAIFKNESHILDEWIQHYLAEGVDHFYLIDNGSTDNFMEILDCYADKITFCSDSTPYRQEERYEQHIYPYRYDSHWLMIVDLDEFVYARNGFRTISDYLQTLPRDISMVGVRWKMFGSNGHVEQPSSVLQGFDRRRKDYMEYHVHGKCITRGYRISRITLHYCQITSGKWITPDGKEHLPVGFDGGWHSISEIDSDHLHLNHYAIQSLGWFMRVKATRGDALGPGNPRNLHYFKEYDRNEELDSELKNKRGLICLSGQLKITGVLYNLE